MRIAVHSLSLLAVMAATVAYGQPAPPSPAPDQAAPPRDVIADLINSSTPRPRDEDRPAAAASPPPLAQPSNLSGPVSIDDIGKTPDGPPSPRDLAYDSRLRASFASAESFQGPLDGGWTISADGQDLFVLQLVDRRDRLEGVWRDPRRKGSSDASGLVDDMQRQGGMLTLRFAATAGAPMTVATLRENGGQWSGELTEGGGTPRSVVLRRVSR